MLDCIKHKQCVFLKNVSRMFSKNNYCAVAKVPEGGKLHFKSLS